jgi:dTDP-4-dehydrorhamnose 3,5-epimerase
VRFEETTIPGVFVVELEPHADERGFFARAFCAQEFAEHGLVPEVAQANMALSNQAGTTRGLHFQTALAPEAKFFRCISGETFNVAVDAREGSPTFGRWVGVHLSAANRRALYIPPLCAAGYQTLTDGAEVLYTVSGTYTPAAERGLRLDDPTIGVDWPLRPTVVSDKDRAWDLLPGPAS